MRVPKRLYLGQPGTSNTILATVPAGRKWVITDIWLANTNAVAKKVSLHLVPSGYSPGPVNVILPNVSVEPNTAIRISGGGLVGTAGDYLNGIQETAGAITVCISGWEE